MTSNFKPNWRSVFLEGEEALSIPGPSASLPLQSATGVFLRTGPCNTPMAPNPSAAGSANFRLQENNKVFRSGVYHKLRAVTWTLGCHANSVVG